MSESDHGRAGIRGHLQSPTIRRVLGSGDVAAGLLLLVFADSSALPSGPWAVPVAFVAILGGAAVFLLDRPDAAVERWSPPDREAGHRVPAPGHSYETLREREFKDRLRERVVASLRAETNCSRAAALEQVEEGRWTDDRLAAAYLGDRRLPRLARVAGSLRRDSIDERARRRAIAALRRLREGNR